MRRITMNHSPAAIIGGHPDWVLAAKGEESCGKLRSSDPLYLGCVSMAAAA